MNERKRSLTRGSRAALAMLLPVAMLAACTSASDGSGDTASSGKSVVYVSTGPIGTDQFLELISEGTKAGAAECGMDPLIIESTNSVTLESNLRAAAAKRPDVIVANSFDGTDVITELGEANPDQKWILVDSAIPGNPNVRSLVFKEHEGMFLIGAGFAELASGAYDGFAASDSVGFVGAMDNPLVRRWYNGMVQGVETVSPGMKVEAGWGNSFTDPATSKELALSQHARGINYIAAVSAAGNSGIFEAAAEQDFFTSGVDIDERSKDPDHIIMSMVKRSDVAVKDSICDVANGDFSGGEIPLGVKEGAVGPAFLTIPEGQLQMPSRLPEEVQSSLSDLRDQIASGEITVTP